MISPQNATEDNTRLVSPLPRQAKIRNEDRLFGNSPAGTSDRNSMKGLWSGEVGRFRGQSGNFMYEIEVDRTNSARLEG